MHPSATPASSPRRLSSRTLALAAGLLAAASAPAQVVLTLDSLTYEQDFDTLVPTNTSLTWVDNAAADGADGLLGWYAAYSNGDEVIYGSNGGTATGRLYSWGPGTSSTERALGSIPNDTIGAIRLGVRFVNATGSLLDSVTVTYTGEQWRTSTQAANNNYTFGYQVADAGSASLSTGTFVVVSDLAFNTPVDGAETASALNGNDPANRETLTATISGLALAPGQELWLRWFDSNSSGVDHGIGIDDLTVAFTAPIPEPSTYAALAGLAGLALSVWHRRRARR